MNNGSSTNQETTESKTEKQTSAIPGVNRCAGPTASAVRPAFRLGPNHHPTLRATCARKTPPWCAQWMGPAPGATTDRDPTDQEQIRSPRSTHGPTTRSLTGLLDEYELWSYSSGSDEGAVPATASRAGENQSSLVWTCKECQRLFWGPTNGHGDYPAS